MYTTKKIFFIIGLLALWHISTWGQTIGNMSQSDYDVRLQMNIGKGNGSTAVNRTNRAAYLELGDSLYSTKALLLPRGKRDSVANAIEGLIFYDRITKTFIGHNDTGWVDFGAAGGGGGNLDATLTLGNTSDKSILLSIAGAGDIGVVAQNGNGSGVILGTIDDIGFVSIRDGTGKIGHILPPGAGDNNYYLPSKDGTLALLSDISDSIAAHGGGSSLIFAESVIKSNDSVFFDGEKQQPAFEKSVYGKLNGTKGFKASIPINNNVNIEHNDIYRYDTTTQEIFSFHTREMINRLQFKARATGWINTDDSALVDSNFISRKIIFLSVDGLVYTSLPSGIEDKWYEQDDVTGKLILHPSPISDSAAVVILTAWTPMFTENARWTAPAPASWSNFDFDNVDDFGESPSNVWGSILGGGDCTDNYGVSNTTIAASTDGAIRAQYLTANGTNTADIGLDVSSTPACYTTFDAWVEVAPGGQLYAGNNGGTSYTSSAGAVNDGDWYGIFRNGSVWTLQISSDGINWTTMHTFSTTSTAQLYFKADAFSTRKISNPQKLD